jgi:hypothetical protein
MSEKKDDWKVVSKTSGGIDPVVTTGNFMSGLFIVDMLTGGDPIAHNDNKYTVEDKYGNQHTVYARDSDELGRKISRGDFDDD